MTCRITKCTGPLVHELAAQVVWALRRAALSSDEHRGSGLWFVRPKRVPRFDTLPWYLSARDYLVQRPSTTYTVPSDSYALDYHGERLLKASRQARVKTAHELAHDYLVYLMTAQARDALADSEARARLMLANGHVPECAEELWRVS